MISDFILISRGGHRFHSCLRMDNSVQVTRSNKGGVKVALDGYMYVKVFSSES